MKRLLGHAFAVTLFGALAIIPSACADNDQSILAMQVMAPPQNRQNGSCLYQADPTQPKISEGFLDVAIRNTYDPMLLIASQMVARGDPQATRAEANRVHINGASVRVTDANGGAISEFSTVGSAFLEPQQNNIPGYGVVSITAIDAATTAKLRPGIAVGAQPKLVIANIKLFGKTLGGVDLESGEFQFPIKICKGCLISFAGDDPANKPQRDCDLPLSDNATSVLPCQAGQDEGGYPCQLCRNSTDPETAAICNGQF